MRLRDEQGIGMIEVMMAALVLVVGVVGTFSTFDGVRKLGTLGEKKQTATRFAQSEIENLRATGWSALQLSAAPTAFSDTRGTVAGATYAPPRSGAAQTLTVAASCPTAASCVTSGPTAWTYGNASGSVYRYVTSSRDTLCGADCPVGGIDHKRVTVAVTVNGPNAPKAAIVISTIVIDPTATPANPTQNANPVSSTGGSSIGSATGTTYYLTDTPAGSTYAAPSSNHATNDTVTATGVPDQLRTSAPDPPVSGSPTPQSYSTELSPGNDGGLGIEGSSGCAETSRQKAHMWVSPVLSASSDVTATGNAAFSLPTANIDHDEDMGGRLCIGVYSVTLDGSSRVNSSSLLGSYAYALPQWPAATELVSVPFRYLATGASALVTAGRRLAVRLSSDSADGEGIVLVYDHPSFPGFVQLETQ